MDKVALPGWVTVTEDPTGEPIMVHLDHLMSFIGSVIQGESLRQSSHNLTHAYDQILWQAYQAASLARKLVKTANAIGPELEIKRTV